MRYAWGTLNTEFYNASRSLLITRKGTLSYIKVAPNAMIPHVYLNKLSCWTGSFEETAKLHNGVQLYANLKSQISIDFYKPKQKSSFSLNPSHERLSTWSIPTNLYSVWTACLGKKKKNNIQRASFKNSSQRQQCLVFVSGLRTISLRRVWFTTLLKEVTFPKKKKLNFSYSPFLFYCRNES